MTDIFELDKVGVRRAFSAASCSYDGLAVLQQNVAECLLREHVAGKVSGHVLDIGCGTGYLTRQILKQSAVDTMTALDIALPMLQVARCKPDPGRQAVAYVCADAEFLPVRAECMDWVFSSLALQWCRDIYLVLDNVRRCLKPGGYLTFSIFGPQTLQELRWAWAQVDGFTHVNRFFSAADLLQLLRQAGFVQERCVSHCYLSSYSDVMRLMRELKGIGAHNVTRGRNRAMTGKDRLRKMQTAYEKFRVADRLPATFEVLYLSARKAG